MLTVHPIPVAPFLAVCVDCAVEVPAVNALAAVPEMDAHWAETGHARWAISAQEC